MEKVYFLLVAFHILFFYKLYANPFSLATSELLSTFFPTWIWQGRQWKNLRIPKYDSCFWINAHVHPVLSTYYPISGLLSVLGNFVRLDTAFKVYVYQILGHYLFGSIGYFLLLSNYFGPYVGLFGALTFYQAYHIKQQPCIVYTLAWFPWIGICPPLAIGMMLLGGYYPLSIYLLPLGLLLNHEPLMWVLGFLIGSIQLVPFLKYLPKTIKAKKQSLEAPSYEKRFYFGVIPLVLLIIGFKWYFLAVLSPIVASYLLKGYLPRVHERMWVVGAYLACFFSLTVLTGFSERTILLLSILHALDLWIHNHDLLPTRPFTELYKKPSLAFNTSLTRYLEKNLGNNRVSGLPWPLFTGLINNFKTLGYSGGMQLKLMAKWRNDKDQNGSGSHDYFKDNNDTEALTRFRVAFAYTAKGIHWPSTSVHRLYRNPSLSG